MLMNKRIFVLFAAMGGDDAREFYLQFLHQLRKDHPGGNEMVKDGQFGAYMQVNIQNDGPVTLELESLPPSLQDKCKPLDSKPANAAHVSDNISPENG